MCKWGDTVSMYVTIPAGLSHTGKAYKKLVGVDRCIAPLVKALNDLGTTIASCCGHGKQPGSIIYVDGNSGEKEIRVCTFEQGRKIDKLFPPIN